MVPAQIAKKPSGQSSVRPQQLAQRFETEKIKMCFGFSAKIIGRLGPLSHTCQQEKQELGPGLVPCVTRAGNEEEVTSRIRFCRVWPRLSRGTGVL